MLPQTPEYDLRSVGDVRGRLASHHSWCTCVVSHGYGGFGAAGNEVVDGMQAGQRQVLVTRRVMLNHFQSSR